MTNRNGNGSKEKSLESWIWDAACSIRGAQDVAKFKDYILPLIFVKRLCDVFDDEIDRIAEKVKTRTKALQLVDRDKTVVRFYLPVKPADPENDPTWNVIRKLSVKIGEGVTDVMRQIAKENKDLQGIIDRIDFNATTHGQRDIDDDRLSNLIEKISQKRLGLKDVEPDIIGRSYEYLIRKFAEGSGQSAGEFYTPAEVGIIMAKIMDAQPGMDIYDPCCGSAGLLVKCELVMEEKMKLKTKANYAPLQLYGQEFTAATWAMSRMNMVIHDMEGVIEIGDTLRFPKFKPDNKLQKFDRVVANPMWNQGRESLSYISDDFFINDELERFPAGSPGGKIDRGWMQHILSSLKDPSTNSGQGGKAAVVLDTGAASRGSGNQGGNKEKECRKWFIEHDLVEGVIYLPENLFYNTSAPGIIIFLNKSKQHKNKIYLLHAGKEFEKGDPKNYITDEGIERIAATYKAFKEEDKFAKMVTKEEIVKNDYNISPSRYIQITAAEIYRPLDILNTVQQAIEKQEQLIRTTTELKKALMQKLFAEGLYGEPQKETEIGLVPESWEILQLGDIAQVTSGGTPSRTEKSFWKGGIIPWIKTGEINYCEITNVEEYITEEGLKNSSARLLKKGTLLMAMYGQGITRGKVAILGIDATVNQACAAIIPKNENQLQSSFLYYYFEKSYDFVRNLGHGANQKNLSGTIIKSIEISFPKSLKEQNEIVKTLKLMDKKIQFHQKKKQTLTDLFKTLLHQLMTGQIRVHDIEFDKYGVSEKEELSLAAEGEAAYEIK